MFNLIPLAKHPVATPDTFGRFLHRFLEEDMVPGGFFGNTFRVDVREIDTAYLVEAELPGVDKKDITVTFDNNYLTITARRDTAVKEEKDRYIRQERRTGMAQRQFYVENVDQGSIEAAYDAGVLTITLPKQTNGAQSKKIVEIR